jgi:hypothetical protein
MAATHRWVNLKSTESARDKTFLMDIDSLVSFTSMVGIDISVRFGVIDFQKVNNRFRNFRQYPHGTYVTYLDFLS